MTGAPFNSNRLPRTGVPVDPVPPRKMYWHMRRIENGGSSDMAVDGSSTPVEFKIAPGAGEEFFLDHIGLIIRDNGNLNPDNFGALTALTNGVLVEFKIDGTDQTVFTIKENWEVALHFSTGGNMVGESNGFLNDKNIFAGNIALTAKDITLNGDDNDELKVTIQDNLTGLTFFQMSAGVWVPAT